VFRGREEKYRLRQSVQDDEEVIITFSFQAPRGAARPMLGQPWTVAGCALTVVKECGVTLGGSAVIVAFLGDATTRAGRR
jgi:hypothetical protein